MFNFDVDLAGLDTATMCKRKLKAALLQKSTKREGPSENKGFNGKTLWDFRRKKKNKNYTRPFEITPVGHQDLKAINWISPL